MGIRLRSADALLPFPVNAPTVAADEHFPAAGDSSPEALAASSWRGHIGIALPKRTRLHGSVGAAVYGALSERSPLAFVAVRPNWLCVDFSVEDDDPRSYDLLERVAEYLVDLVGGELLVAQVEYHEMPTDRERRRGLLSVVRAIAGDALKT